VTYGRYVLTNLDSERFVTALHRFAAFFTELEGTFIEREDLLKQIALGLLCREHVLMTGPPGTAKSRVASSVVGRILDEVSGEPSLFARQFTESTVQTDLVGPIDFKTLMETGRTEHFTDEGMLGSVHAFLDEVLDGRDMLLRSTLNVLQERELKQGSKVTRGRIECALMTTNRYLSEILETSRDTLLAFVDRIAFVSFVPKGFAKPESLTRVLRSQIAETEKHHPKALLTIQDLDVLQSAVESVYIPTELCDTLVTFLTLFEAEIGAAIRADPTFVPTRYLSTRTAVRLGSVLRAVCVFSRAFDQKDRALEVSQSDFESLRLCLLLSGPRLYEINKLLERETDPRERRQLTIMRTEREIFERCIGKLPPAPRPTKARVPEKVINVGKLETLVKDALPNKNPQALIKATEELASAVESRRPGSEKAVKLLQTSVDSLIQRALRAGMTAGIGPNDDLQSLVDTFDTLADSLEKADGDTRPVSRWLRGQAIVLIEQYAALSATNLGKSLQEALTVVGNIDQVYTLANNQLSYLEHMWGLRDRLYAKGVSEPNHTEAQNAWKRAVERTEDHLVSLWDEGFRTAVRTTLEATPADQLSRILKSLTNVFELIDNCGLRLAALGGTADQLKKRVVGPRLSPLISTAFHRFDASDRLRVITQVESLLEELKQVGLEEVIPTNHLLELSARSLIRTEKNEELESTVFSNNYQGFRNLRQAEQRISISYTMIELTLRIAPQEVDRSHSMITANDSLSKLLSELPPDLLQTISRYDFQRILRSVELLERWWFELEIQSNHQEVPLDSRLKTMVNSRFFHIIMDESALVRFAMEAQVIGKIFPQLSDQVDQTLTRIKELEERTTEYVGKLFQDRANHQWEQVLAPKRS
jgi:MoxR-like ATPase/regulator of replication initiation timing